MADARLEPTPLLLQSWIPTSSAVVVVVVVFNGRVLSSVTKVPPPEDSSVSWMALRRTLLTSLPADAGATLRASFKSASASSVRLFGSKAKKR